MLRAIVAFAALAAIAVIAVWVAERPGGIVVDWGDYRVQTSLGVGLLALGLLIVAILALSRLWRLARYGPAMIGVARATQRQRQGVEAFAEGMVAVAAGDARRAGLLAQRAERYLPGRPLALMLAAQAAQLAGDEAAAERRYEAMLAVADTEFLGLRGLAGQARRRGDLARALDLVRRAAALRPDSPWALAERFDLEIRGGDFAAAAQSLHQLEQHRLVTGAAATRRRAVLALAEARKAEGAGRHADAVRLAAAAQAAAPGFAPAAALRAAHLLAAGKRRRAGKVLAAAWSAAPHPDLTAAWFALHAGEPARRKLEGAESFAGAVAHDEARLLVARAALEAGDFARARAALESLDRLGPRGMRLMAELDEVQYGDHAGAVRWRDRADAAPPEAEWACASCPATMPAWAAVCPNCGAFDSLAWRAAAAPAPRSALGPTLAPPAAAPPALPGPTPPAA